MSLVVKKIACWERVKQRKKHPALMDMVKQGAPKTAGKKPSGRKWTNVRPKPIESYVDLLEKDESECRTVTA
jgi:hypothetical protein